MTARTDIDLKMIAKALYLQLPMPVAVDVAKALNDAAELILAIDHVHVPKLPPQEVGRVTTCLFDGEVWPCWHHRQLHPEDPVVQEYVENLKRQMEET